MLKLFNGKRREGSRPGQNIGDFEGQSFFYHGIMH